MEKELLKLLEEFEQERVEWNENGIKESADYPFTDPAPLSLEHFFKWLRSRN